MSKLTVITGKKQDDQRAQKEILDWMLLRTQLGAKIQFPPLCFFLFTLLLSFQNWTCFWFFNTGFYLLFSSKRRPKFLDFSCGHTFLSNDVPMFDFRFGS